MGYSTDFHGAFTLTPPLTAEQVAELGILANTRHEAGFYPSYYCQWVPSADGKHLEWDGNEKFNGYMEWLQLIIDRYLRPWGVVLAGEVVWEGEERSDLGTIRVKDNKIDARRGTVSYG